VTTTTDTWIERVRAADAEAERVWVKTAAESYSGHFHPDVALGYALIAIAAELRAQRIARRPGAGK